MDIYENDSPYQGAYQLTGNRSLVLVIQELNGEINQTGNIITAINLNGSDYFITDLPEDMQVKEGDQLKLKTASPVILARNTVQEALNQLDSFETLLDTIIDELLKGEKEKAFNRFNTFLEDFRQLTSLLQTIEVTFKFNYAGLPYDEGKTIEEFCKRLVQILADIKNAMENEDLVTLTDLLEYEVKPLFSGDLKKVFALIHALLSEG